MVMKPGCAEDGVSAYYEHAVVHVILCTAVGDASGNSLRNDVRGG